MARERGLFFRKTDKLVSFAKIIKQQKKFNSRLLKLNDDADIMEELKGLTPEQIKALIALVKKS